MDAGEAVGLNKAKDQQQRRSRRYLQSGEAEGELGMSGCSDRLPNLNGCVG